MIETAEWMALVASAATTRRPTVRWASKATDRYGRFSGPADSRQESIKGLTGGASRVAGFMERNEEFHMSPVCLHHKHDAPRALFLGTPPTWRLMSPVDEQYIIV